MYANSGRHQTLAAALPISGEGPVVDLGCERGPTLRALRERFGPDLELVGVEKDLPTLDESLAADANLRVVAADLREPLPFPDETFEAALCHNTLECLTDKQAFLREVARVLRPGGHLLLSHTDFDTVVFNASDLELTRRLVHANADTQEQWMDDSDGTIGRKLVGIGRRHSSFELVDTLAWVVLDTSFAKDGVAHMAVRGIAASVKRDHHDDLAAQLDEWIRDLATLAERGEFLFSANDYAVLLRTQPRAEDERRGQVRALRRSLAGPRSSFPGAVGYGRSSGYRCPCRRPVRSAARARAAWRTKWSRSATFVARRAASA